jgi:hypothetical protein
MKMPKKNELLVLPEDHVAHFAKKWFRLAKMKGKPIAKRKFAEIKEQMKRFSRLAPMVEKAYWEGYRRQYPARYQAIALSEMVLEKVLAGESKAKIKEAHYLVAHNFSLQTFREKYGGKEKAPAVKLAMITFKLQEELGGYIKRNWSRLSEHEQKQLKLTKERLPGVNLELLEYEMTNHEVPLPPLLLEQAEKIHREAITHLIGESRFNRFNRQMNTAVDMLIKKEHEEEKLRRNAKGGARKLTKKEIEAKRQRIV